jgi:hypothetical protein
MDNQNLVRFLLTFFLGVDWQYNYQSHFIKAGRIYF